MPITAYTVLTEFKFEAGSALVQSEALQNRIDGIADSAQRAMDTVQGLGMTFVANFGLGASSVLGVLGEAIKSSDSFYKAQLAFSNIIGSNLKNLTGDISTFNDRLGVSKHILKDISADAQKFGLDEGALTSMTKLLSGSLVPKGLAGDNFGNARTMSRQLLKSAPVLGVDPNEVQGQLLRSIEGKASFGDTLFRRLAAETEVFKDKFGNNVTKSIHQFNKLTQKDRFEMLSKGLAQFASDTDILAGNAQTLGAMMQRLRDMFVGLNGILKPIGDAILPVLRMAFENMMKILNVQGRATIENFSRILKMALADVEQTAINLKQASRFGKDFKRAGESVGMIMLAEFLAHLGLLGPILKLVLSPLRLVIWALPYLVRALPFIGRVFLWLSRAALEFTLALLPLLFIFQVISRAIAIARINDLKKIPDLMARMSGALAKIGDIFMVVFGPAFKFMDYLAKKIAWIFEYSMYAELAADGLDLLTKATAGFFAAVRGGMWAIFEILLKIPGMKKLTGMQGLGGVGNAFAAGKADFYDQLEQRTKDKDGVKNVSGNITNIDKVEINNMFKEQLEPDRIAFTLRDQLQKAAMNPKSARGRSLQSGNLSQ
jgi:hypothetical protein